MQHTLLNLVVKSLLILTIVYSVSSIQCYICLSQHSWQDCKANLWKMNCTKSHSDLDACEDRYQVEGNKTYFIKSCTFYKQCSKRGDLCRERNKYCETKCCRGNLCNGNGSRGIHDVSTRSYVLSICLFVLCVFRC